MSPQVTPNVWFSTTQYQACRVRRFADSWRVDISFQSDTGSISINPSKAELEPIRMETIFIHARPEYLNQSRNQAMNDNNLAPWERTKDPRVMWRSSKSALRIQASISKTKTRKDKSWHRYVILSQTIESNWKEKGKKKKEIDQRRKQHPPAHK